MDAITTFRRFAGLALVALACTLTAGPVLAVDASGFARCIRESGATYYGAHWCPNCARQHERFGSAADLLPYVECYEPGTRNKRQICDRAGVTSYPTWVFGDGSRRSGNLSLETLAYETGCEAPARYWPKG
jgi:hypothetical protein